MTLSNLAVLGIPIDCTGNPGMCDRAPTVLRRLGLIEALGGATDLNDLGVRIDDRTRDPASGVKGAAEVIDTTRRVRQAVDGILRAGQRPVLIGGCCSYVMGVAAAARDLLGRIGMVYVDGHMDLYDGRTSPGGECADMPLAFLVGRGPDILDEMLGPGGQVAAADVSLIAYRDAYMAAPQGSILPEDLGPGLHARDVDAVRRLGFAATAAEVLERQAAGAGHYWLHLDWDVLDERALPSSDYLMPNGLEWDELVALVRPLVHSPRMIGLSTACYNPDNDPDMADGRRIVAALEQIFG